MNRKIFTVCVIYHPQVNMHVPKAITGSHIDTYLHFSKAKRSSSTFNLFSSTSNLRFSTWKRRELCLTCSHMLGEVLAEIARSTCRTNFARQYRHLVLNALP